MGSSGTAAPHMMPNNSLFSHFQPLVHPISFNPGVLLRYMKDTKRSLGMSCRTAGTEGYG